MAGRRREFSGRCRISIRRIRLPGKASHRPDLMNLTRRQFVVTAAATTAALAARADGGPAPAVHLLALGDWGAYPGNDHDAVYLRKMQKRVATEMAAYLAE